MSSLETWLNNSRVQHALRLAFVIMITVVLVQFRLDVIEFISYDLRSQLSPKPKPSGHIVLIKIDSDTVKSLQREPNANDWTQMLQQLAKGQPMEVVSFINPTQIAGGKEEQQAMANATAMVPFVFGENDLPKTGQRGFEPLAPPFEKIDIQAAPKTSDNRVFAKDGVTRRFILEYENNLTMHPRLAAKVNNRFNDKTSLQQYQGTFPLLDSTQAFIRYRSKDAFPSLSFRDVISGQFRIEDLKNKIIMIGHDTKESAANYVTTPLSKEYLALSILEVQASALDTLILDQAPRMSPDWLLWLLTFSICLLTLYVVLSVRPGRGLLMLGAALLSYSCIALIVFAVFGWAIPMAHPLVVVFICYYFVIPYRLIVENRRSWEYYQKNQLLTQVEELKSNFMRMMSHDLKTPLARIQGMAELMQKESPDMNENQRKAIASISESSEELTEFIGSILSLSRIESKDVKLQLHSRDINQLVQQLVSKFDYMAKRKNIAIVCELEPLFSVKMDEDLIRQVLSNLIENAIKYSPENSKILVSTEEANGFIIVQVADQGRGIPMDERSEVFSRFFRGRDARTDTSGSGLGLYLAKYFVELHKGSIDVESELGKGSTFTVRIPMVLSVSHPSFEHGGPNA